MGGLTLIKKKTIIYTAGSFDLVHAGHINILTKAKKLGDYLIVAVSSDELIEKYKNLKPIISYKDRVTVIKELKCVDKVIKQTELADLRPFKRYKADFFVLGDDWKENYSNKNINWLRNNNKIVWLPYTKKLSTTDIKKKIITQSWDIVSAIAKRK